MIEIRHRAVLAPGATQAAYDALYAARELSGRSMLYRWLISLFDPQPGRKLVDISCGQGLLVEIAHSLGLDAVGVDFSFSGLLKAQQAAPAAQWLVGDGERLPLGDATADYVTHIGSLEHYEHMEAGAAEIARILKPTGRACVLLPNAFGLLGNVRYVFDHGEVFDDGQPLQRYATRQTWTTILQRGGLEIERLVAYGEVERPHTAAEWRWLLARPQKIARGLLAALTPINLANHFVFICRRAPQGAADRARAYYPMLPPR
jgi:ubiquinone/menaquinone biosynthesis C-methylase UbiE